MAKKPVEKDTSVDALIHEAATRLNIPTKELQSFVDEDRETHLVTYPRAHSPLKDPALYARERDLDPQLAWGEVHDGNSEVQLVWRGKDEEDGRPLSIEAAPLYIQETIVPKAIIEAIRRRAKNARASEDRGPDLFAEIDGIDDEETRLDFYSHDVEAKWRNRLILGDALQVMASLSEKENLRGKVQCIYMDPPYGIKFNSNWQVSTRDTSVKDGKPAHESREPDVVRAFRDTWKDNVHSYLDYLRDRFTVSWDLLSQSGSFFLQIGQENLHYCRAVLDEVFGRENFIGQIAFSKTSSSTGDFIAPTTDYLLWFAKNREATKFRKLYLLKKPGEKGATGYNRIELPTSERRSMRRSERADLSRLPSGAKIFFRDNLTSQSVGREKGEGAASWFPVSYCGRDFRPSEKVRWKTNEEGMDRLLKAGRIEASEDNIGYVRYLHDFLAYELGDVWSDTLGQNQFGGDKIYVVQTALTVVRRCILLTTDPGDLVLDPTCGSGTTAFVSEQWGRRWITIDTSRVALALARARMMSARFPHYLLQDSEAGALKEAEVRAGRPLTTTEKSAVIAAVEERVIAAAEEKRTSPLTPDERRVVLRNGPFKRDVRAGFVYERIKHIKLGSITNNSEINLIWNSYEPDISELLILLNASAGTSWQEWEVPIPPIYPWTPAAQKAHAKITDLKAELQEPDEEDGIDETKIQKRLQRALKELNAALSRTYASVNEVPQHAGDPLPSEAIELHAKLWNRRRERQAKIDASINLAAGVETLVDRPYSTNDLVRVSGPFTVESLSPHRVLPTGDDDDWLNDETRNRKGSVRFRDRPREQPEEADTFVTVVLENLAKAGVGNTKKDERLRFTAIKPFPGHYVNAEGRYIEGEGESAPERKVAIFIGPEYGTVTRSMIIRAAKEAADLFDVLIVCGFAFEAHASPETMKLGRLTVQKVTMNQDLRMAGRLKPSDQGNLFVAFGEPDVDFRRRSDGLYEIEIRGVDIFNPNTGEQRSSSNVEQDVACWFLDDDYDESQFFVRHAYFLGGSDPYDKLRIALKADINEEAWSSLYTVTSHPFPAPSTDHVAVKVINHYGDEVMKIFQVSEARV